LSASLSIIVVIDDVNDNSPLFERPLYQVTLAASAAAAAAVAVTDSVSVNTTSRPTVSVTATSSPSRAVAAGDAVTASLDELIAFVVQVRAHDIDSERNAHLTYHFATNTQVCHTQANIFFVCVIIGSIDDVKRGLL